MSREEKESYLAELDSLVATDSFSTVVFPGTAFVTLFPTIVETLKRPLYELAILMFIVLVVN